jgi:hypothetical protein
MAKLLPDVVNNKCRILGCSWLMCQKCWHWYDPDPSKAKHPCHERIKPTRDLLKECPGCRRYMSGYEKLPWADRDRKKHGILRLGSRITYSEQHPKRNGVRPEMAVRNTRATNTARLFRPVR